MLFYDGPAGVGRPIGLGLGDGVCNHAVFSKNRDRLLTSDVAERGAALLMLAEKPEGRSQRITVGVDKAYDSEDFVCAVRELNQTPQVTKNEKGRASNLDRRTTRQPGYAISLSRRRLIEKGLG